jgi:hypothetical protein
VATRVVFMDGGVIVEEGTRRKSSYLRSLKSGRAVFKAILPAYSYGYLIENL